MEISAEQLDGSITRIKLAGRLDIEGTSAVETRLAGYMAVNKGAFILDLADVSFLASIGIRAILLNAKAVQRRGGSLVLLDPAPEVAKVLSLAGIDTLIPVCSGLDAARAAVSSS
jgi:anti-sigma B factor antagonist